MFQATKRLCSASLQCRLYAKTLDKYSSATFSRHNLSNTGLEPRCAQNAKQIKSNNFFTFNKRLYHVESSQIADLPPASLNSGVQTTDIEAPSQDGKTYTTEEPDFYDPADWQSIGDLQETQDVDVLKGISPERGSTGVFDIEEFVEIIKREKLIDIAVIAVPPQLNYVDYMVISTGKSAKQMTAVAEFIRKIYKIRANPSDSLPVIEGKNNKDWIALDLGNIAFHAFSAKTRALYDLETLWTCGAEFDDLSNEQDQSFPILPTRQSFPTLTP